MYILYEKLVSNLANKKSKEDFRGKGTETLKCSLGMNIVKVVKEATYAEETEIC